VCRGGGGGGGEGGMGVFKNSGEKVRRFRTSFMQEKHCVVVYWCIKLKDFYIYIG
jgi:hypothetical protein